MFFRLYIGILVAFVSLLGTPNGVAHARDILLAPGDRIALVVIGTPQLDTTAVVDADGMINLPIVGRIAASGFDIETLGERVAEALSLKPLRLVNAEQPTWLRIEPASLFLSVAEYRPIFVTGNVALRGEKPFRPGMTARQALALAGDMGLIASERLQNDIARLVSEGRLLEEQLALAEGERSRLATEQAALDTDEGTPPSEPGSNQVKLLDSALQWIAARAELRSINQTSSDLTLQQMRDRLAVLQQLEQVSNETLRTYDEEYNRVRELAERGVATASAVTDAERGLLAFSTRALETGSEVFDVRTEIARTIERTEAVRTTERVDLLRDLLREERNIEELRAAIATNELQLSLLGRAYNQQDGDAVNVIIFRLMNGNETRIEATLDATIFPGDVIEFTAISTNQPAQN